MSQMFDRRENDVCEEFYRMHLFFDQNLLNAKYERYLHQAVL
jgi:hypothetical protein